MGLNETPSSERTHIGFFGIRNAGKSSLVNKITQQDMSIVSDTKGTTTDSVHKSMELLPIGAVVIIDTPGIDDEGALGELRVESAKKALNACDIALLVTENEKLNAAEIELLKLIKSKDIPYLIVHSKADLPAPRAADKLYVSAKTGEGIEALKERIAETANVRRKALHFVADFIQKNDTVVLVTPIDESAPKARMILPQQQAIRDIIDAHARAVVVQPQELADTLMAFSSPPALVVTDSQVFATVMQIVPEHIPLTSFSILMARYKEFLNSAVRGAYQLDKLPNGAHILISEGCTHHRQCNDIGTVKLPAWIRNYTHKDFQFSFSSGHTFPDDLTAFNLIVHCGGCMLGDAEMKSRQDAAEKQHTYFTNYGTLIAHMNGILERSLRIINE